MKNKLYEDILQGLNKLGEADALNFESCVIELLRKNEWPNIVPIEGGRDAGMDGVALDGSERIILIATISRGPRVLENVTRNLKSNRAAGYTSCGVLVATPDKLSQTQCGKIEARIRELGSRLELKPDPATADLGFENLPAEKPNRRRRSHLAADALPEGMIGISHAVLRLRPTEGAPSRRQRRRRRPSELPGSTLERYQT